MIGGNQPHQVSRHVVKWSSGRWYGYRDGLQRPVVKANSVALLTGIAIDASRISLVMLPRFSDCKRLNSWACFLTGENHSC